MEEIRILGAGLAGLLAACRWPKAKIIEHNQRTEGPTHKALLRFRDESVAHLTGIPFRRVRVDKSIFFGGVHHAQCSIPLANAYAKKVTGRYIGGRSIWNLESVTRYVAPEDFQQQLLDRHDFNITFNKSLWSHDFERGGKVATVSTIPMQVMLGKVDHAYPIENLFKFERTGVFVRRFRLPEIVDLHQTVYFPSNAHAVYRASITGSLLTVEESQMHWATAWNTGTEMYTSDEGMTEVLKAFGLDDIASWEVEFLDSKLQEYGKIVEMPREDSQAIMYELTREYNIFSLGRFATWRNILLDDVVKDMEVIDRLMRSSAYSRHQFVSQNPGLGKPHSDDDIPF